MTIVPAQRPVDEVQHLDGAALSIPSVSPDDSTLDAALAYARCGWFVLPVRAGQKRPGSVVGDGWQTKSSRDPQQIVSWFAGTDHGIALHVGRSGAAVFDVDYPEKIHPVLAAAVEQYEPPRQATRFPDTGRGHLVFALSPGLVLGNGTGRLGTGWGDVRGTNGVIIVSPSVHELAAEGGAYHWTSTGLVPVVPGAVSDLLPRRGAGDVADAVTNAAVATFLAEHSGGDHPELMGAPLAHFEARVAAGASRHESAVEVACWLAREARAGLYDARPAFETLESLFLAAMAAKPTPGRHPVSEYRGILAWAIGQAALSDPAQVRAGAIARVRPALPEHPDHDAPLPREVPAWEELRQQYPVLGTRRPPRSAIFEVAEDKNGEAKVTGNLLVETVARYIDQDFAEGGDRRMYVYRDGVFVADDAEVMRRTAWVLGEHYSRARHGAVADFVSVLPRPALPDVPDPRFINCANGMVEVASGELLPHGPSHLSYVQLPVEYHPGATCPRFDAWLAQVLPADTVPMLWELLGYLLLHGNPLQVAVLLHGAGGNGKGTLLRVVRRLLGNHNVSAVTLQEITEGKFETAAMYGKQANAAGDIDATYLKNTARFKAITGGDVINAQHKNAKPFEFTCWAVPIFSANELWRSSDVSRGYFRRWVPIPFPHSVVAGEEPFDEEMLYAETAGIFAKALPALGALLRRGRFELSYSSKALLTAFEEQADSVLSWMGEDDWLTTHEPSAECWTARTKLHHRYRAWCAESGHVALSSTKFFARLGALGYQPLTRQGVRGYRGLALLAQ